MNFNPYESPVAPSDSGGWDPVKHKMELVSQGKRFINYLIDRVIMTVGTFGVGIVLGVVLVVVDPDGAMVEESTIDILGYVVGAIFVFFYFVFFEMLFQKTPGKLVTGTRVVNKDGGVPSFGQILGRSACRFIPFEAISFLFGDSSRVVGWHDEFSGTRVVRG